jgi:hypothetical protein
MDALRILIFAAMAAIVLSLGTALVHLTRGGNSQRLLRALTVRIVLSLALFFLIMVAWWFGLIHPNGYR